MQSVYSKAPEDWEIVRNKNISQSIHIERNIYVTRMKCSSLYNFILDAYEMCEYITVWERKYIYALKMCIFTSAESNKFESRVFLLLEWLPYQGRRAQSFLLFISGWRQNNLIQNFPQSINTFENCEQSCPGIELVSPCPIHTTLTIAAYAAKIFINRGKLEY